MAPFIPLPLTSAANWPRSSANSWASASDGCLARLRNWADHRALASAVMPRAEHRPRRRPTFTSINMAARGSRLTGRERRRMAGTPLPRRLPGRWCVLAAVQPATRRSASMTWGQAADRGSMRSKWPAPGDSISFAPKAAWYRWDISTGSTSSRSPWTRTNGTGGAPSAVGSVAAYRSGTCSGPQLS